MTGAYRLTVDKDDLTPIYDLRRRTRIVYPGEVLFPFDEHTSYTAAAVILAVDAITRTTQASNLFVD